MIFGAVLRPDGFNATLESIDTGAAEKLPGAQVVRDGDFTGVVATDAFSAQQAISTIQAKWNVPAQPSNRDLFEILKATSESGGEEGSQHVVGSVEQAMAKAGLKLEEQYTVQYIAHAPLEPRAAVAEWSGDNLTVWTGTQRPFGVRDQLAQAFHILPPRCASFSRIWAAAMAASIQVKRLLKPLAWQKPPASPSRSCGRARRNLPGPIFAPPA